MMSAANIIKIIEIASFSTYILKANISITSFTRCNLWNIRYMWLKLHCHFSFTFVTPENARNSVSPVSHLINTRTSTPFR